MRVVFVALFFTIVVLSSALAEGIRIGAAGVGGAFLPLWIARDKGFFQKSKLDCEVITFQGEPVLIQSLVAGDIRFSVGGFSSGINARMAGADVTAIAVFVNTLPYTLVASGKIQSADHLKGKRFAVSRLGSVSDIGLRMALRKLGVDPKKEAVILGVGDQSARFGALRAGTVDATVITPPLTVTARKMGFNVVTSFQDAGIKWAYNSIVTTTDFARGNRETVVNFLKAFLEGIAFVHKNRTESMRVLAKWMRLNDQEALEEALSFLQRILESKPFANEEGVQAVLDATAETNPKAKKFKPQDIVDMTYLLELDRSGFIDHLYH
ncbi:MAG: ABC transporter substrate-binding protein [Deltaproteobacteria bacterium]|nr:ABC transporter substrate-binding protein [Deltaproteobacteria bacterium]